MYHVAVHGPIAPGHGKRRPSRTPGRKPHGANHPSISSSLRSAGSSIIGWFIAYACIPLHAGRDMNQWQMSSLVLGIARELSSSCRPALTGQRYRDKPYRCSPRAVGKSFRSLFSCSYRSIQLFQSHEPVTIQTCRLMQNDRLGRSILDVSTSSSEVRIVLYSVVVHMVVCVPLSRLCQVDDCSFSGTCLTLASTA